MDISLEKIELVKDRTGVTYAEANQALEKANGNVVDAIIAIEESIDNETSPRKLEKQGEAMVEKIKEIVKRGNVSKVVVKKDDVPVVNFPVNVGVLGAVIAPWGVIAGVLAMIGLKCKVEVVKDDGTVIDVSAKAGDVFEDAKAKGGKLAGDLKGRAPETLDGLKEMVSGGFDTIKEKAPGAFDDLKEKAQSGFDAVMDKVPAPIGDAIDDLKEKAQSGIDAIRDKAPDAFDDLKEKAQSGFDVVKEKAPDAFDALDDLKEKAQSGIEAVKEKVLRGEEKAGDFEDWVEERAVNAREEAFEKAEELAEKAEAMAEEAKEYFEEKTEDKPEE